MMNNTSMNQACKLKPGTSLIGKWNKNIYTMIRLLGEGATGVVYLADSDQGRVALKLSENSLSITSEVNVLKHFSKVQGSSLGPCLLDVDDFIQPNTQKIIPFYVMEYVGGTDFLTFVQGKGIEWVDVLILQLLTNLEQLHRHGWVFGDLKPDNLIVSGPPTKIRCIDVGGTTMQGRSIKEFTEFFDRGYWGLGTRKAEPAYDLFAVAMIMVNVAYPKRFSKKTDGTEGKIHLFEAIDQDTFLKKHKQMLVNAILGKYNSAAEMKQDLLVIVSTATSKPARSNNGTKSKRVQQNRPTASTRKQVKQSNKRKKTSGLLETIVILIGVFLIYSLYVMQNLM
ncbi:protein kinase family protein [Metabacillus herbersteinensis]|uniref:Protein kinase family protein n=1 Tax=Metabacillus herbersteinensis TaxID=283816 RepID=A0ABV6GKT2_9BACI